MTETSDHLATDHLDRDLAARSTRGSMVALAAEAAKLGLGATATVVLARLLQPSDFGLVAMALATVGMLSRLKDAGLATATVQTRQLTQSQASALFWISAALAVAAGVATLALAPAVAWFYGDPRLLPITAALASVPLLDGLALQHQAVMTRQMRLVALSVMDAATLLVGAVGAIALAGAGAGPWALVGQELLYSAAYTGAAWTVCRWRPGRPRIGAEVRPLVTFGLHLSGFRVLNYLATNLDTIFVGRYLGALVAGIYDRGYRLLTLPSTLLHRPLTAVAVPALSLLQGDHDRYRSFYRAWIQLLFALTMPLVAFLFVDAERAVLAILGDQWLGVAPIFRVLAPAAFIGRFNVVTRWLYTSTGRVDRQLRWSAVLIVPLLVGYAVGVSWGALGVALAHTIVICTFWYPGIVYCCRTAPVRPREILGAMLLPAAASSAAALGLFGLLHLLRLELGPLARLAVDLSAYAALYAGAWLVVPRGRRSLLQFTVLARAAIQR